MMNTSALVGFVATAKPAEAKRFYQSVLGLTLLEDGPHAFVFDSNGTPLRVQKVQTVSAPNYTALGWNVSDINGLVQDLSARGVVFERYPGLSQDPAGIWRTRDGSGVAWFRDPHGNTLSLTERAPR